MPIIWLFPGVALQATFDIIGPLKEIRFKMALQEVAANPGVMPGITEAPDKPSPMSSKSNPQASAPFPYL